MATQRTVSSFSPNTPHAESLAAVNDAIACGDIERAHAICINTSAPVDNSQLGRGPALGDKGHALRAERARSAYLATI